LEQNPRDNRGDSVEAISKSMIRVMVTEAGGRSESREANVVGPIAMRNGPLRAAIVGAGLMGHWHAQAIEKAGGNIIAVVDVDPARARGLARRYRAGSFPNVEQMLSEVELDVLHICSPASTHQDIGELAINSGLNLVVEKPVTPTARGTVRLYEQAARRGVLVCPVHQFVFQNGVLKAQKLLPRIGRLLHLGVIICSAGGDGLASDQLDSIAADILPHPLSLLQRFLPGELPEEDWVMARPRHGELRVSGEAMGATLSIFVSMNARPTVCDLQIVGTEGTIHLNLFHGYAYLETGRVSRTRKIMHPFEQSLKNLSAAAINLGRRALRRELAYPGLQRLVSEFYRALETGAPSPISAEEAIAIARVRDQLLNTFEIGVKELECVG
jgi:predicted dehydrogenase